MKIALDAMGGDFAPQAAVDGAVLAAAKLAGKAQIVLIGQEEAVRPLLQQHGAAAASLELVHATQIIEMGEHPAKAYQQKQDSSIAVGYRMLHAGEVEAFCSAGNTGAMLVGAMFSVKPVSGVLRPAIANFTPKLAGGYGILLDVGANAECKPEMLEQFGELGSLYAQYVLGIARPKVGLMSLGEEEGKGTTVTQAAHQLLKVNPHIHFIGNIEGRDLFNDKADVVICDGYTGNVLLKMAESIYEILDAKQMHDPFFDKFNYEAIGGSPILGINDNAIIGHGVSTPLAICNMLLQGYQMAESGIADQIKSTFKS
ncbi:phosphate:acyl-[acyl carrier protein] acyltransferase [Hymenobacter daecheongensis DSM 21074]|uniref:Phosphate acyltransferase n=1 Tax=Hymenobacter daecheongensis DSM 21074 TaxID=1121955 RepID=A0A1M6EBK5_9BACT|nr:phosphate acyltransferase PlsX [Hymenobacter daecheongensis]SHI82680.1 phosphate:acyl-[acyl carrier protein] acyltransferase [Hymenobacter daecheongensis DSM 21074]